MPIKHGGIVQGNNNYYYYYCYIGVNININNGKLEVW